MIKDIKSELLLVIEFYEHSCMNIGGDVEVSNFDHHVAGNKDYNLVFLFSFYSRLDFIHGVFWNVFI